MYGTTDRHAVVIHNIERFSADVVKLQLRVVNDISVRYQAGQFIAIHFSGGVRCYSMARRYVPEQPLEFHIRLRPGGVFSQCLAQALDDQVGFDHELLISGPFGNCTWHSPMNLNCPILMLGNGTGIAPLAALLEEGLIIGTANQITLYWGGRHADDFYYAKFFEDLSRLHQNFRFVPVLEKPDNKWSGRYGFLQNCAAADFSDLTDANVYACGSSALVTCARQCLVEQCRLDTDHFYADAFESSAPVLNTHLPKTASFCLKLRFMNGHEQVLMLTGGTSLMVALQNEGWMQGICGGRKSCGNCRVGIAPEWISRIPPADRVEVRLLAALNDPRPQDRLACQIVLSSELDGLCITDLNRS